MKKQEIEELRPKRGRFGVSLNIEDDFIELLDYKSGKEKKVLKMTFFEAWEAQDAMRRMLKLALKKGRKIIDLFGYEILGFKS